MACNHGPSVTTGWLVALLIVGFSAACSDSSPPAAPGVDGGVDAEVLDDGGVPDAAGDADRDADLPDGSGGGAPDGEAPPGELLLYDGDGLQFTEADNGFHPLIQPGDPLPAADWSSPVDYYQGQMQIRYVISGPAGQEAGMLQTCIWTMGDEDGDGRNYFPESCGSQVAHTGVGEYFETNVDVASWWKNDGVSLDFAHPERFLIRAVLRGDSGCNVTTYGVANACWDQWPKYDQMTFRLTMVMVPPGTAFSGWDSYP